MPLEKVSVVDRLVILLKNTNIDTEKGISECLQLFKTKKYDQLKQYPQKKLRKDFGMELDKLIEDLAL